MSNTIGSVPPPPGVTPNFEHPEDVFHTTNLISNILCVVIVTPILLLRLYTQACIRHAMNREDWACLIAWLIFVPYITSNLLMGHFNGGYHQWEVTELGFQHFMAAEYASAVIYGPMVCSIKVTLLLIFTRIFAPSRTTVVLTYVLIAFISAFYIPMFFIKIGMCTPVAGFWDASLNAKCIDEDKLFLADTLMSVVSDTAVLALPLPSVWALNLPVMTRIRILGVLGAGVVATATTVVRLVLLLKGGVKSDLTFTILRFSLLGSAEASIGLICASLPALNALFAKVKMQRTRTSEMSEGTERQRGPERVAENSFGSSGRPGKKGGILRTDESILQWTYVGMEDEKEDERSRNLELGLVKTAVAEVTAENEVKKRVSMVGDESMILGSTVDELETTGDMWSEARMSKDMGRNKPLPLLPQIDRLSNFTIWQEIREIAELRRVVVAGAARTGLQESEEDSVKDSVKDSDLEGKRIREELVHKGELDKPGRTWEDR